MASARLLPADAETPAGGCRGAHCVPLMGCMRLLGEWLCLQAETGLVSAAFLQVLTMAAPGRLGASVWALQVSDVDQ